MKEPEDCEACGARHRIGEDNTLCPITIAVQALMPLTDEQRLEAFYPFCTSCGCIQSDQRCQCWNDE